MAAEGERFSITFTVPGAPRGKRPGNPGIIGGHATIFPDPKTKSEMAVIRTIAADMMAGRNPYDGPLILRLCAYTTIPASMSKKRRALAIAGTIYPTTKPDLDNYNKMVDALNKIVWVDDAQVVSAVLHKRYSEQPRLTIDIRSMAGE